MVDFSLFLLRNGSSSTIHHRAENLTWTYNKDSISMKAELGIARSQIKSELYEPMEPRAGDILVLRSQNNIVWQTIIVSGGGKLIDDFTAYDFAWYLGKNEVLIQFKNLSVSDSIKRLLSQIGFPAGDIVNIPTKIDEIFNQVPSEIISSLLEKGEKEQNKKYFVEFADGKLHVREKNLIKVEPKFQPSFNVDYVKSTLVPQIDSFSWSIEEMKNKVNVINNDNKIIATAKNQENIDIFGELATNVVWDGNSSQAQNVANNTLKQYGKASREARITLLGDVNLRPGRYIELNHPKYYLQGKYEITNAVHKWTSGNIYTTECDLLYVD